MVYLAHTNSDKYGRWNALQSDYKACDYIYLSGNQGSLLFQLILFYFVKTHKGILILFPVQSYCTPEAVGP